MHTAIKTPNNQRKSDAAAEHVNDRHTAKATKFVLVSVNRGHTVGGPTAFRWNNLVVIYQLWPCLTESLKIW